MDNTDILENKNEIKEVLESKQPSKVDEATKEEVTVASPFTLGRILRCLGGLLITSSAVAFIGEGYADMSGTGRFYSFLSFLVTLSLCGMYSVTKLKDAKAARTFVGMASAMMPALFLQLGALIYSLTLSADSQVPKLFLLKATSQTEILIAFGVAIIPIVASMNFCFSAFAKIKSKLMTLSYFALNCLLLIPTRDPQFILLISLVSVVGLAWSFYEWKELPKTWEYNIAKFMHIIPLTLLVGRNLALYDFSAGLLALTGFSIAAALFFVLARKVSSDSRRGVIEKLSIPFIALGSISLINSIAAPYTYSFQLGIILTLVIVNVLSVVSVKSEHFRCLASCVAMFMVFTGFGSIFENAELALMMIVASMLGIVLGHVNRERFNFFSNCGVLMISLSYFVTVAYDIAIINPWLSLAMLGTISILSSSLAEKRDLSVREAAKRIDIYFGGLKE